jgi:hypothetical protein
MLTELDLLDKCLGFHIFARRDCFETSPTLLSYHFHNKTLLLVVYVLCLMKRKYHFIIH